MTKTNFYKLVGIVAILVTSLALGCTEDSKWRGTDLGWDDPVTPIDVGDGVSLGDFYFGLNDPTRFLALGAGLATGSGDDFGHSWPERLDGLLVGQSVINAGQRATRIAFCVHTVLDFLQRHKPGFIVIMHGTNDIGLSNNPTYIANSLLFIAELALENSTYPIIATIPPAFNLNATQIAQRTKLNTLIRGFGTTYGIPIADVDKAFNNNSSLIQADGLHPTDAGYQLIAQTFYDTIPAVFGGGSTGPASE